MPLVPPSHRMYKILMVCMGNLCRSPLAASALQALIVQRGLEHEVSVASAGTHARRHVGQRYDPRAIQVALQRGYGDMSRQRARTVSVGDFQKFDRIVAMDAHNLAHLRTICPPALHSKLHLLLEFASDRSVLEVPDPYYGNLSGFERVLDLCEAGAAGLLENCLEQQRMACRLQQP